jgi:hypothetical protein
MSRRISKYRRPQKALFQRCSERRDTATTAKHTPCMIAPDLRGLGESRSPEPRKAGYTVRFQTDMRALLVGKTMAGMQVL